MEKILEVEVILLGGRVKNFPISFAGYNEEIPIIPYGDLAKLVVDYYHKKVHKEVDSVVAHVRQDCWVVKCRKIAAGLDGKYTFCRKKRKQLSSQVMGDMPLYRTTMQPPFSVVGCDLWGPIIIRDDVVKRGKRVHKKVFGVLFTCTASRAVYLDVACGSSTEELLHTVRRALARHGQIKLIISDPGSNLVGAAREMAEWRAGWDLDTLTRFGAERGLEFQTIMAASQHQNGMS